VPVSEFCYEHGVRNASFCKWRAKFGGMDASVISELKAMAGENNSRKSMGTVVYILVFPSSFITKISKQ